MKKNILLLLLAANALTVSAQNLVAAKDVIDCGQVIYNQPVTTVFEMTNNSHTDFKINDIEVSCGCTTVDYPKSTISGGQRFQVNVTFDARQMGHFEKQLLIHCDGVDKPTVLTFRGVVVESIGEFSGNYPFDMDGIKADKNDLEFDDINQGDLKVQKINILNTRKESVEPQVMRLPPYLSARVAPSRIAPGHGGEIILTLDSKKIHDLGLTQTDVYLGHFPGDKISPNKEIRVSAVLLHDFNDLTSSERAVAPRLTLSNTFLNLGRFGKKKTLKGKIEIKNNGKTALDISSLQMFTSGLEVSLSSKHIEAGKKAYLKVTAIAEDLRKVKSKPRVLMITNDPKHSKVVIPIITTW